MVSIEPRTLYVIATPIGNLGDMSARALQTLREVDLIAAEDTRHSRVLLRHFGIDKPMTALHEHNERQAVAAIVSRLTAGERVALISDAGTPLVSDPGYHLTRAVHEAGLRVSPVPGPCAAIASLSVAGLPSDRFLFLGFLPAKAGQRRSALERLRDERETLLFYEAPHRIAESLADMAAIFGGGRIAVLARELTKTFETVRRLPLEQLAAFVRSDPEQQRGEAVIVVDGAPKGEATELDPESGRVAEILSDELPIKQAAALAAKITGAKKNALYQHLLKRK